MNQGDLTLRITGGPIEDLGLKIDDMKRVGFVSLSHNSENPRQITSHYESGMTQPTDNLSDPRVRGMTPTVYEFLTKNDYYLAHAKIIEPTESTPGSACGDIYQIKET